MKKKHISSYELEKQGFSRSTYYAMKYGKSVTVNTINQLCTIFDCDVSDIMRYVKDTD